MATPNGRGGWDLTDADVDAIAAASGFEVERDEEPADPTYGQLGRGHVASAMGGRGSNPWAGVVVGGGGGVPDGAQSPATGTNGHGTQWATHDAAVATALERAQQLRPVPPWSAEYKLRSALGRPALAKRIVDNLPQPLAVELGDVLWIILQERVKQEVEAVQTAVERAVKQKLDWMEAQTDAKREELRRERFGAGSRLS